MKPSMAFVITAMATVLAGCGNGEANADRPVGAETPSAVPAADTTVPAPASTPFVPGGADLSGTPAFAALYPGARLSGPMTLSEGPAGPGGIVTFTTDANPETVIRYYREQAEGHGLTSMMAMNQGEARAYGAVAAGGTGASLQVVADPVSPGSTSVQLTWSAGR